MKNVKTAQRNKRHRRVRAKITGTAECPRLSVFKSNKHLYAQLIDDEREETVASSSDVSFTDKAVKSMKERAKLIGEDIAAKAKEKKIIKVVFDRGGFTYTGNIKELADAARKAGIAF